VNQKIRKLVQNLFIYAVAVAETSFL